MNTPKVILLTLLACVLPTCYFWFVKTVKPAEFKVFTATSQSTLLSKFSEIFPKDLAITVNKGEVTINKPSPYCLVFDKKENLGVLYDEFAIPDFKLLGHNSKYNYLCKPEVLVGKNFIMYLKDNAFEIREIGDLNLKIDYQTAITFIDTYYPDLEMIYYGVPVILIVVLFLQLLFFSLYLALVLLVVSKLFKNSISSKYTRAYKLSVLSYTLFNILTIFLEISFPFLPTIFCTIVSLLISEKIYPKTISQSLPGNGQTPLSHRK